MVKCNLGSTTDTLGEILYTRNNYAYKSLLGKEDEAKMNKILSEKIIELWYERKKESIEANKKKEIARLVDNDIQVKSIRTHLISANALIVEYGLTKQISCDFTLYVTKDTKNMISKVIENSADEMKALDKLKKEILSMLLVCDGNGSREAEVLVNYGITGKMYGKLTV